MTQKSLIDGCFSKEAKKIFGIFDLCMCSNIETKNYLKELNLNNVHFKGNIKFINDDSENKSKDLNEDYYLKKDFG